MKFFHHFAILIFILFFLSSHSALAQIPELNLDFWHTTSQTQAIAEDSLNNVVYLGGFTGSVYPNRPYGIAFDKESGTPLLNVKAPNAAVKAAVGDGSGGWYIGGDFTEIGGVSRMHLAKFDADGNLTDWNPGANGSVSVLRIFDDLLYVGGDFTALAGKSRLKAASFNLADGTLTDWSANLVGQKINDLAVGEGKVYMGGLFNRLNLTGLNGGVVDANTGGAAGYFAFPDGRVNCSVSDGNGGFFIGGMFTSVAGIERQNIAHLDSEGNVSSWNPGANGEVKAMKLQDSMLLVGGSFSEIAGITRESAAALNPATGDVLAWNPRFAGEVLSMDIADQKIFVGGIYSAAGAWAKNGGQVDGVTGDLFFSGQYPDGTVRAAISDGNGGWFIGGEFLKVGNTTRERIAHINAAGELTDWYPGPVNSAVRNLVLIGDRLFIGGDYNAIGNFERSRLAVVDAQSGEVLPWSTFPSGPINAMLAHDDVLYLAGGFTFIGDVSRQRLAAVDPYTGEVLPLSISTFSNISALEAKGDTLFFGGSFTSINGITRNRIACLSIDSGELLAWNPNANNTVLSLAILNNTIFVGGTFTNIAGLSRIRIAAIDITTGNATSFAPSNLVSSTSKLVVSGNTLYAGGNFQRTNGTVQILVAALNPITGAVLNWDPKMNDPSFLDALAVYGNSVYIGGDISSFGGAARKSASAFDLTTGDLLPWNPMMGINPVEVHAIHAQGQKVFLGGLFSTVGGLNKNGLVAVDIDNAQVSTWNLNLNGSGQIRSITGQGNTVFVGGTFTSVGGQNRFRLAAVDASSGAVTPFNANLTGGDVSVIHQHEDVLYIGGSFTAIAGVQQAKAAAVNAVSGTLLPWNPEVSFGGIRSIEFAAGKLYLGGSTGSSWGGTSVTNIATVDYTEGLAQPFNVIPSGEIFSLYLEDSTLYFGGSFQQVNSSSRSNFASINTLTEILSPLNPIFNGPVKSIAAANDNLWIGGGFTTHNGNTQRSLAVINKSSGLINLTTAAISGSFMGSEVLSIVFDAGLAYITGGFLSVGGQSKPYLATLDVATGNLNEWNANIDGVGRALAVSGSTVFAGGDFIRSGLRPSQGLIALSTNTGAPTGFEMPVVGYIRTLKVHNNVLYIGGGFSQIGGQQRTNLAAINLSTGTVSDWAPQTDSEVWQLEASGDLIFAAGEFSTANDETRQSLAAFHSQSGELDSFNADLDGIVYSILLAEGRLYIGGFFNQVQGESRPNLAAFDAQSTALLPFNPEPNSGIGSLAFANQTLYVVGSFTQIAGQAISNLAALDALTGAPLAWDVNPGQPFSISQAVVWKDQLVLRGPFITLQNQPRNGLASVFLSDLSVTDWNPDPQKFSIFFLDIWNLQATSERLYVFGDFNVLDGTIVGSPAVYGSFSEGCAIEAQCQDYTLILENGETTLLNPDDIDAGSSASCGVSTISVAPNAFGPDDIGANTVTLTVTDALGNTASCESIVTVLAAEPFSIQCPENMVQSCSVGFLPEVTGYPTATSACGIATIEYADSSLYESCSVNIVRTWTVTDSCGISESCEQLITLLYNEAPELIMPLQTEAGLICSVLDPQELLIFLNGSLSASDSVAYANNLGILFQGNGLIPAGVLAACSEAEMLFLGYTQQFEISCPAIAAVQAQWVAVDACGNQSEIVSTAIVISDFSTPVLFGAPDIILPCGSPVTPDVTGYTIASDNCDDSIEITYSDFQLGNGCPLSIVRLWTAVDACGNFATYEQQITLAEQPSLCASPPGGLVATPLSAGVVQLSWNPVPGSIGCRVFGRQAGSSGTIEVGTVTGNAPSSIIVSNPVLKNGLQVEWRVICACNSEPLTLTPFSAWSYFVFFVAQGIADPGIQFESLSTFSLWPNPTDGVSTIVFRPAVSGRTTLELFDLSGRRIEKLFDASAEKDSEHSLVINGNHLPNGVYFFRLTTGLDVKVQKLVISR